MTVTDAHGGPVANLQKENFLLKEDGKEQRIAIFSRESALPLSIVLAIDTSLSTKKDLPLEQAAAQMRPGHPSIVWSPVPVVMESPMKQILRAMRIPQAKRVCTKKA